ncbi:NAD-dependent epimerase/dehydratase family protein [soil metagenome]
MKCLVTGGTGFVGGHLCEHLAREGWEVLALARGGSDTSILTAAGVKVIDGYLDSMNVFAREAAGLDVVFHLAGITKAVKRGGFDEINIRGTQNLMSGLRRGEFRGRVVHVSSQAAGGPVAFPEHRRRETDPDQPVSEYGRSKLESEEVVRRAAADFRDYVILRPGAIYGPREHEILEILRLMWRRGIAVKLGSGVRIQMTHVDDVVRAIAMVATRPEAANKMYYVVDRELWSFEDIVRLAAELLKRPVRIINAPLWAGEILAAALDFGGMVRGKPLSPLNRDKISEMDGTVWAANPLLIDTTLGWRPKIKFPDGLRDTIEWYRANGKL